MQILKHKREIKRFHTATTRSYRLDGREMKWRLGAKLESKLTATFKKMTTFFKKTCFDASNIIVSYIIFEKPLGLNNN